MDLVDHIRGQFLNWAEATVMTILEGSKIADFITESLVACLDDLEY